MSKTRLLCLLTSMNGGGAERVMIHLLKGLDRQRFQLTLGLAQREGPFIPLIPRDVEVIDFNTRSSVACAPRLAAMLRAGRFDLCFSMVAMNFAAVVARGLSGSKAPLVLGARNHYSRSLPAEASHAPVKALAVRALYPRADMIIGVAQGVCDDLAANFGVPQEKLRAIHNPIDLTAIQRQATAPVAHPWLASGADRPVILNVGKLQVAKAQADLIAAFRLVRDRLPARLIILGQGPLRGELESLSRRLGVDQDVAFLGFQDNPYAFMARSSVFVLSSAWEGFPNVLAEAMAAGPAVISTDCPSGPSEIIRDGLSGLLTPVGQPERLASAILRVLTDEPLRRRLAAQAATDVRQFSEAAIVGRYVACFEELVARGTQAATLSPRASAAWGSVSRNKATSPAF